MPFSVQLLPIAKFVVGNSIHTLKAEYSLPTLPCIQDCSTSHSCAQKSMASTNLSWKANSDPKSICSAFWASSMKAMRADSDVRASTAPAPAALPKERMRGRGTEGSKPIPQGTLLADIRSKCSRQQHFIKIVRRHFSVDTTDVDSCPDRGLGKLHLPDVFWVKSMI